MAAKEEDKKLETLDQEKKKKQKEQLDESITEKFGVPSNSQILIE